MTATIRRPVSTTVPVVPVSSAWPVDPPTLDLDDPRFVAAAGTATRTLPAEVHDALVAFADRADRSGALLLRGAPVGEVPPTPPSPTSAGGANPWSEFALLTVARRLGQPVGYQPEHGGRLVQNIVPTQQGATLQVSTSSRVTLMFHTETAFHPHRPRYLLLLCLRGDPSAVTTLASIHDIVDVLPESTVAVLREPRFRTAVDASFLDGRPSPLTDPRPILSGTAEEPTFIFDEDLTTGIDEESQAAVEAVIAAIREVEGGVVLEAGDLLVVDNNVSVHGRSPYEPRFDGTDRWLQRTFVVSDLAPSASDRVGRVITTHFGA
jgi:L-asparagine oxygenase